MNYIKVISILVTLLYHVICQFHIHSRSIFLFSIFIYLLTFYHIYPHSISLFSIFTYFNSDMFGISYRSQLIYQLISFVCLYVRYWFPSDSLTPDKKPRQTHLFDCWPIMEAYIINAKVPSKSAVQLFIKPTKGLRQISPSFRRRLQSAQLAQVRGEMHVPGQLGMWHCGRSTLRTRTDHPVAISVWPPAL